MFPLPRFLRLVTISAKIVRWTSKSIQAIAICAALCAMAMANDDGDPAPCPPSKIPAWGTWYHGKVLCFVGSDPRNGPGTTAIGTPVIPVVLRFLDSKGDVVETLYPTDPLNSNPKLSAFSAVVDSPIFQARDFKFGKTSVGTVQWIEATERASFWNYPGAKFDNWHIVMVPLLYPRQTLDVSQTDWHINSSDHLHMVDGSAIADFINAQLPKYEGELPIFLVYNTNLYNPDDGAYHHNHVSSDGNNNPYIFTCYEDGDAPSPNLHPLSHEIAEYAHDPFLSNKVDPYPKSNVPIPWNPSYVFTQKDCGTGLEVGDPVGHKGTGNALSIDTSAMTYNFQNIAVASWFMDANPSFSVNGWYTLGGAINGEFTAPAPDCPSIKTRVDKVSPDSGPVGGGTTVTLTGDALSSKLTFDSGGSPATGVTCPKPTTCSMVTPSHNKPESVGVIVRTPAGDSNAVAFQYFGPAHVDKVSPDSGPLEGGTKVTMSGDALSDKFTFYFGLSAATGVTCPKPTTCTMVTPPHDPGSFGVIVWSLAGPSNVVTFKYLDPAINSFTPAVGPTTGGLNVNLTGVSLSDH